MSDLSDRIRAYEVADGGPRLDPSRPVIVRLDGVGFSTFTRSMTKPFDPRLSEAMVAATCELVRRHSPKLAYTQSDEISLLWDGVPEGMAQVYDGRVTKLASVMAGLATSALTFALGRTMPAHLGMLPHMDGRAFSVPDREEAANALLARTLDCRRNAVSMAAHATFPRRNLTGVPTAEKVAMLAEAGVTYDDYPEAFRLGTFVRRTKSLREFTAEELEAMPPLQRPKGPVVRSTVAAVAMPCAFVGLANRVGFAFEGEEPVEGRYVPEGAEAA